MKNRNQYSETPKDQNERDLIDQNVRVTNANVDHQDTVTIPSPNPQIKTDFSDDSMRVIDDSGGQTSLKITLDKQTPDDIKRGILSQTLMVSIRSRRSAIGYVDSGFDMNPDVANIIDNTLTKAVMVINNVANVGSLGSGNSNWALGNDITMQGDSDKIDPETDIEIYMIPVLRTSEKSMALGSNNSESSYGHIAPQRFYAEVTYDEYTSEYRYLSTGDVVHLRNKTNIIFHEATKECYMLHETV